MVTSRMGITSHMHIIRGMGITGLFVVPGGRGAGRSLVTTRTTGRLNIIATDRTRMAIGEHSFAIGLVRRCGPAAGTAAKEWRLNCAACRFD